MKTSRLIYAIQIAYAAVTSLFVVGVLYQVYLTGQIVVTRTAVWSNHVEFGFGLGLTLLVMLPLVYLGRLPRPAKRITWALLGVYILQVFLIGLRSLLPLVAPLHPVLALVDFALGWWLARVAWQAVSENRVGPAAQKLADPRLESAG